MALTISEQQIESLAPNSAAFSAGKALSNRSKWLTLHYNERAVWGEIKGSGSSPYQTQIDTQAIACKCSCPSRQFPCKHGIALLLLFARSSSDFTTSEEEPTWVKSWIDKRTAKSNTTSVVPEVVGENQAEKDESREKTQIERMRSVQAGVEELELWINDLVRIGLMELPNKPLSEFERVAARMVDAKASGLASWIKGFTKLNYTHPTQWQDDALQLIAKIYLLIATFKNYENLSPQWQVTIRNLIGWNQSTKELLASNDAFCIKDKWLVIGQEIERNDDLVTARTWLIGCETMQRALILNFGTKFSPIENVPIKASIITAEMAFFPSVLPFRAVVKQQRSVDNSLTTVLQSFKTWNDVFEYRSSQLTIYPWFNDCIAVVDKILLIKENDDWLFVDENQGYVACEKNFDTHKLIQFLLLTSNKPHTVAGVLRNKRLLPLGVFTNNGYICL